jgi:polar amino acid transport system substrate-binding protein
MITRRLPRAVLLPAVAVVALSACGSSSKGSGPASPPPSASASSTAASSGSNALAALVPADVKAKGTLVVAEDASYPPNEFFDADGKTVIGMDADLAAAIAEKLGLKPDVRNAGFDGILAGISSKKFDLGMSSFTDNAEREKVVDFVTYFSAGTSFFAKKGSAVAPAAMSDLCGLTVAVEKGTTQQKASEDQSAVCTKAGKKAVTVGTYPDQSAANLALTSGRADVSLSDSPVAAYIVSKSGGSLAVVGKSFDEAPYGVAIAKGSGLVAAVKGALEALVADGTYTKILTKWGVQAGAITTPVVNGATS